MSGDKKPMTYYPIFLDLKGKVILVVGGGRVAQRKVEALLDSGAEIRIVSSKLTESLNKLVALRDLDCLNDEFQDKHLEDVFLVIAATDDRELNHRISDIAKKKGLLVNAVDQPSDCNFIVPSIVRQGDLQIAVSTSGKSPALARKLRKQLDKQFGDEYESFLILMGCLRKKILAQGLAQEENSRIFNEIVNSDILDALLRKDRERTRSILRRSLPDFPDLEECLECLTKRNAL